MADEDQPPPLPKRPTIIRSVPASASQNGHKPPQPIPARPAPPRPVPKPPTPTQSDTSAEISQGQDTSKGSKGRPSTGKSSSNNNTKRKLEITIVDARPMNEIAFRDVKVSPASATPPNLASHSSPKNSENVEDKKECLPVKSPPARPSRPAPLQQDSISSHKEISEVMKSGGKENDVKDSVAEARNDPGEAGPPKPKRPTIIRPQSMLMKQHAVTSQDVQPDMEEMKSPPPLPSLPPCTAPKVPPLPSRPPVAPTPTAPTSFSRPPPPKPKSQPVTPSSDQEKVPKPAPRPRPRSTVIVNSTLSSPENSSFEDKTDVNSAASLELKHNIEPQPSDLPPKPKRPTIIRPKSEIFTSKNLSNRSPSQDIVSPTPSPSAPARPQPPASSQGPSSPSQRPLPMRPAVPSVKQQSSSNMEQENVYEIVDDVKESQQFKPCLEPTAGKRPNIEDKSHPPSSESPIKNSASTTHTNTEPVYSQINKAMKNTVNTHPTNDTQDPESNKLPFQVKLKSTLGSTQNDEASPGTNADVPPPLPAKPKPNIKPKPKPSLKPKPTSPDMSHINQDSKKEDDAKSQSSITPVLNEELRNKESKMEKKAKVEEPHHISAAFLSKFEPAKNVSETETNQSNVVSEENNNSDKGSPIVEMRKSQSSISSPEADPPRPSKRPMTIIGRPSLTRKDTGETDDVSSSSLKDTSVSPREPTKLPPAPKRPVTIIGFPRKASKDVESMVKDTEVEEIKLSSENTEHSSPEKVVPFKPSLPPQIVRPPPPASKTPSTAKPVEFTTVESVHEAGMESSKSSVAGPEEGIFSAQMATAQKQNEENSKDVKEQKSRPPGPRPPRPVSSVPKRTSLVDEEIVSHQKAETSPPERLKPPRPQPAKPPAPKTGSKQSGVPPLPPRPTPGHTLYHYMANQLHGIALHDYVGSQSDELSFQAGDVVLVTKEVDQEWMAGKMGLQDGIFPKDFVDLKYPRKAEATGDWPSHEYDDGGEYKPDTLTGPRCRARFDFEGEGEGELAIEDGDVIRLISHMGSEWMKGELSGQVGIFPSAFVEIIEDVSSEGVDISPSQVSAMFDFDGEDGELSFQADDTIDVKGQVNSEWLYGECGGRAGKFPASFVSHIPHSLPQHTVVEDTVEGYVDEKRTDGNPTGILTVGDSASEKMAISHCVAIHDYDNDTPGDLKFQSGDKIEVLEFVGDDWLQGRCHGEEGLFPVSFVVMDEQAGGDEQGTGNNFTVEMAEPPSAIMEEDESLKAVALYDFEGETGTDLFFKAGDLIELDDFVDDSHDWRWGIFQGRRGMFPSAFVELQ